MIASEPTEMECGDGREFMMSAAQQRKKNKHPDRVDTPLKALSCGRNIVCDEQNQSHIFLARRHILEHNEKCA